MRPQQLNAATCFIEYFLALCVLACVGDNHDGARHDPAPIERAHPSWSPDGAWIAFDANVDGNVDIYFVRPDGTNLQRLTSAPGQDAGPRWHPASDRIYFWSDRGGDTGFAPYEIEIASRAIRPFVLGDLGAVMPAFSPDGRHIAFQRTGPSGPQVWWATADGADVRAVAPSFGATSNPIWSRDGRRLAFSVRDSLTAQIHVVDASGSLVATVPQAGGRDIPRDLDGDRLLFHSDRAEPGVYQTYLFDLRSRTTRQLTAGPFANGVPSFSPDGRMVLFESNRDGATDLYLMDLDNDLRVHRILP